MRCPQCDLDNRAGRKFCAKCGAELGWDCPACGFANSPGEGFCGGCGCSATAATPAVGAPAPSASASEAASERRQVAILFADLCGFTALSAQLDAEDLGRLVEGFYARADAIVAQYGGSVDKHIGDAVMALFGAPVAHGDDALRALRAALDIQASVAELSDPSGNPLASHVGIAAGEVVAGGIGRGYSVLGDAVNLAARLVELALPGETVISEPLARLLEGKIRATALPPAVLKGIASPVSAWRVAGLTSGSTPTTPFVGRQSDLLMLRGLLQACSEGSRGRVVVLRGEAGIGKTRLLEETLREAQGRGFAAHKTLVLDFGTGKGQDAMRLLTRSLLGIIPGSDKRQRNEAANRAVDEGWVSAADRPSLDDLLDLPTKGEGRALYQAMDEATRQARRRALLAGLAKRLTRDRPLFIAVEDVHWADATLLDDLAALAGVTAEAPVVLALTTRPEGDPIDRRWRAKSGAAAIGTIDLSPLTTAEASQLAADLLGTGDERIAACVERAEGNPFFLEQLLRHTGEIAAAAVPASVQSLVLGRADRLPPTHKRALQAASVLGQRVPLSVLRHLLGDQSYEATYLIDEQFLTQDDGGLAFVHALMRDGVYGSLLKARRRELHRAAAGWYGERDLQLHAQHLDMAEDPGAAMAYLAAAESATAAYRTEQALSLAQRGLALVGADPTRASLASLSGELQQGLGRTEEAISAFRMAADAAATGRPRLRAQLGLAHGLSVLDRLDEAMALLDQAQREAEEQDLLVEQSRIHTLRGNAHFPRGEIARCLAEHSEALRLAEASGAMEEQARALGGLADANYMRGLFRTSKKMFERCLEICAARGFRRIEAANLPMLGMMLMMDLQFPEAMQQAIRAANLAEQIGHRRAAMISYHGLSFIYHEIGQPGSGLQAGSAGLAIARSLGARRFIAEGLILQAQSEFQVGDPQASKTIREANEIARETPSFMLPFGLALAAMIACNAKERAAALAEGERVLGEGAVSHNFIFFNRYAIEACLAANDWTGVDRYAAGLERSMAEEPFPMTDFLVARGRAIAAAGRGQKDATELRRLLAEANRIGWLAVVPALETALARD
ncbi:MAG TPA: adenylate/guanylate cyclase domain-containing protein [Bradyrhizobium sp.]|nr:adenylate/guanylate cyclase domain-containing protein [Bradyrhizobium sp.]